MSDAAAGSEPVTNVAPMGATSDGGGHLQCPFCTAYEVGRLYIASINVDSCECAACGARWDEECGSGQYRGRADRTSVLIPPRT